MRHPPPVLDVPHAHDTDDEGVGVGKQRVPDRLGERTIPH
jgi:hypothetical protein